MLLSTLAAIPALAHAAPWTTDGLDDYWITRWERSGGAPPELVVAMTRSLVSIRGFAAETPFFGVLNDFWPDLLKVGFNCRDLAHTWCPPRIHPW